MRAGPTGAALMSGGSMLQSLISVVMVVLLGVFWWIKTTS